MAQTAVGPGTVNGGPGPTRTGRKLAGGTPRLAASVAAYETRRWLPSVGSRTASLDRCGLPPANRLIQLRRWCGELRRPSSADTLVGPRPEPRRLSGAAAEAFSEH